MARVKYIRKSKWNPVRDFFMTMRLPLFDTTWIFYPYDTTGNVETDPIYKGIREHEMIHVKQMETWWGLLLLYLFYCLVPLPIVFSGRWFIERPAYLLDIQNRRTTPERAARILWTKYGWIWPEKWMVKWFKEHLHDEVKPWM